MSFAEQENVLFALLFDRALRDDFCARSTAALSAYALTPAELADFTTVRPDALALDARMRAGLILSQFCRSFPLTFSIVSSLHEGMQVLRELVDVTTMRTVPLDRVTVFGLRLRDKLAAPLFSSAHEQALVLAILDAELGMARTAALLKAAVLSGVQSGKLPAVPAIIDPGWQTRPLVLAPFASVAVIPHSYVQLKHDLCACEGTELWRHLGRTPLAAVTRSSILEDEDPRLLVTSAYVSRMSPCEPAIEHRSVELSAGFATFFQYMDGNASAQYLLAQLQQAGAPDPILQGVAAGLLQLIEAGMLVHQV